MTKEKMKWKSEQDRWQRDYKRRTLYITPKNLGGTCREDTVVLANRWFDEQKARIDAEDGIKRLRPHEPEHREELEKLQAEIKRLSALLPDPAMRPIAAPVIEISKGKVAKIKKELSGAKLTGLEDSLRSPLSLSEKEIGDQGEIEAFESQFVELWEDYERNKYSDEWLKCNDYYRFHHYETSGVDDLMMTCNTTIAAAENLGVLTEPCWYYLDEIESKLPPPKSEEYHERLVESVVDTKNFFEIRFKAKTRLLERRSIIERKKEEVGVIDDYSRGILTQRLDDGRLFVPETKKLPDHIDKFVAFQETRHKSGKIGAGQLGQIVEYMKSYRKWTQENGAKNVDIVGTKDHIDAYYDFLLDKTQRNEIAVSYAKKLFAVFKRFVWFLIDEKTLASFLPPWEGRRDDKYTFKIETTEPKILSLDTIRTIYEAAPQRIRLFMLLVMNCGFGQAEIGRLKKSEYDPDEGTITHKRIKTKKHKNAPKVTYRLWSVTKELLDQQIELQKKYPRHPEHQNQLLLNENGKPLWSERFDDKHRKSDNITCQFKRFIADLRKKDKDMPECTFYMFRRTVSTTIFNSDQFSNLDWLFLGHAPKTTAGQHYSVALAKKLDPCMKWLEEEILSNLVDETD